MQIEGLAKRVAEKLGIKQELAEEVCRSEFKFLLDHVKLDEKPIVSLIYIGKVHANKKYKNQKEGRNSGNREHISRVQKSDIQE